MAAILADPDMVESVTTHVSFGLTLYMPPLRTKRYVAPMPTDPEQYEEWRAKALNI